MRILLRSAYPSTYVPTISDCLVNNLLGNNIGNILFQNSIFRWIKTDDNMEIHRIRTTKPFSKKQINQFNEEYDLFVIPLANAFRASFLPELKLITELLEQMTIPCVVVGIGIQNKLGNTSFSRPYNDDVKRFIKAVLKKSAMIGLRGECTASYLKYLGFTEEKDFTVVGCPSVFTYGYDLPEPKVTELTVDSPVSFNCHMDNSYYNYLLGEAKRFHDYTYVCTVLHELRELYVGYPYPQRDLRTIVPDELPIHFDSELVKQNHIVSFVDEGSWIDFLKTREFSFGSRIHGTIANVLAGTPVVVLKQDSRVEEIATYHNIPLVDFKDIEGKEDIFSIHDRMDFSGILRGHKERVDHYVDFLDLNHVPHLTAEEMSHETPFDREYFKAHYHGEIRHFIHQDPAEQENRLREYFLSMWKVKNGFEKKCEKYEELKVELSNTRRELKKVKDSKFYKLYDVYHTKIKKD